MCVNNESSATGCLVKAGATSVFKEFFHFPYFTFDCA